MEKEIYTALCGITSAENIQRDEWMKNHTTFRIGGPADYFVTPGTPEEVRDIIRYCRRNEIPYFVLGNGSNLLVSDRGYRGVVIQIYRKFQKCAVDGEILRAGAGILLSALAAEAREASLAGLEFASGIPGTLGGACAMNAGAYGGEMKDVLTAVTVLDDAGSIRDIPAEDLHLGYRTSLIKENQWTVLGASLRLQEGDRDAIGQRMEELKKKRVAKQPLQYPSAGSTFKRPAGYFAGKLIQDAGLRGFRVGGAQVSEKHCGFVINTGSATAADVYGLICQVQRRVWEQFSVRLEPEVKFLGDFEE